MAQLDAEQQAEMERLEEEERKKLKKMLKGDKKYARKRREEKIKAMDARERRDMAHELMDIEYGIEDAKRPNVAKGGYIKKYANGGSVRAARF